MDDFKILILAIALIPILSAISEGVIGIIAEMKRKRMRERIEKERSESEDDNG